jgi:hypothetical protein
MIIGNYDGNISYFVSNGKIREDKEYKTKQNRVRITYGSRLNFITFSADDDYDNPFVTISNIDESLLSDYDREYYYNIINNKLLAIVVGYMKKLKSSYDKYELLAELLKIIDFNLNESQPVNNASNEG